MTAKLTVVVTAACSAVTAALVLVYNTVVLKLVRRKYEREVRAVEHDRKNGDA